MLKNSFFLFLALSLIACRKKDYVIIIKTKFGEMKAIMYEETPLHKENFIKLAREGFYDSLVFHRVISNFMIQAGDPESRNSAPDQHLGSGGPGYTIPSEINPKFIHEKGALSAARLGDQVNPGKSSSGSQFYIVHGATFSENELRAQAENANFSKLMQQLNKIFAQGRQTMLLNEMVELQRLGDLNALKEKCFASIPIVEAEFGTQQLYEFSERQINTYGTVGGAPHLDGQYTVFGKVVEGLEIIDKIATQPTDSRDRPLEDVHLLIELTEQPRAKITELYGYHYPEN